MNKIVILTIVIAVSVIGFLSLPNNDNETIIFEIPETDKSKIIVGNVEITIDNDQINELSLYDQILPSETPDIVIPIDDKSPLSLLNQVEYSFEEDIIDDEITVNKYELTTTITYNDGSENKKSSFIELQSLDFLTLDDMEKEFDKGKLSFKLSVPINKQIRLAQSEFTVNFIDSNSNVKTLKNIYNTKSQSDVKDGMIVFLDDNIQFSSILNTSPTGINKLIISLDKLFIIYDDNSREYANPNNLYSGIIEMSDSKYIITNELGSTKFWDSDIPLTISTSPQTVTAETCVTKSSTGCTKSFKDFYKVASPKLGQITITNLETNNEVVKTDSIIGKGACINKVDSPINLCEKVGTGTKFTFMLQRDTSYRIEVGSPQNESFVIDTPETAETYDFTTLTTTTQTITTSENQIPMSQAWCSQQSGAGRNGVSYDDGNYNDRYGYGAVFVRDIGNVINSDLNLEDGGTCTVKVQVSRGNAWYNYGYKTVTVPVQYDYDYDEQITSNFP